MSLTKFDSSISMFSHQRQARSIMSAVYGPSAYGCPEGIPIEQALFGILAAFGASFGVLFTAVTQATQKRKRRSSPQEEDIEFMEIIEDLAWLGRMKKNVAVASVQGCT